MHADSIIIMFSRLTVRAIWTIMVSSLTHSKTIIIIIIVLQCLC